MSCMSLRKSKMYCSYFSKKVTYGEKSRKPRYFVNRPAKFEILNRFKNYWEFGGMWYDWHLPGIRIIIIDRGSHYRVVRKRRIIPSYVPQVWVPNVQPFPVPCLLHSDLPLSTELPSTPSRSSVTREQMGNYMVCCTASQGSMCYERYPTNTPPSFFRSLALAFNVICCTPLN